VGIAERGLEQKQLQEKEKTMHKVMSKILNAVRDERGAEMVEWIVVVAVLATVAAIVFGPSGVLSNAMNSGVSHISNIITTAS